MLWEEMGQIAGFGYARDAKGNKDFSKQWSYHKRTSAFVLFGSALPKWVGGFLNLLIIKG